MLFGGLIFSFDAVADFGAGVVSGVSTDTSPPEVRDGVVAIGTVSFSQFYALKTDGRLLSVNAPAIPASAREQVVSIATAPGEAMVLKQDGSVVAWGNRPYNAEEVPVSARTGVIAIASTTAYRAVLTQAGEVVVWGGGRIGALEVPAAFKSGIRSLAASTTHVIALTQAGEPLCWNPLTNPKALPVRAPAEAFSGVDRVFGGDVYAAAIKSDGSLVLWRTGVLTAEPLPAIPNRPLRSVRMNSGIVALVFEDGGFLVWNHNFIPIPQLGGRPFEPLQGMIRDAEASPFGFAFLVNPTAPSFLTLPQGGARFESESVSLSVEAKGYPLTYQWAHDGQPIPGATESSYTIYSLSPQDAGAYTVAVSNSLGSVTSDPPAQVTVGRLDPSRPSGDLLFTGLYQGVPDTATNAVVSVALSYNAAYAVKPDGTARGWGQIPAVDPAIATGLVAVSGGYGHVLALHANGTLTAWGQNNYGQISIPSTANNNLIAIAAGYNHSMALKANGSVICWGAPDNGRCSVPTLAQHGIKAIAAGGGHSLAVTLNGEVVGWGLNDSGQISIPDAAKSGVVAVAAGLRHSMALRNDGAVICWGLDDVGQCTVPTRASSGVRAIAAGRAHSAAIRYDGTFVGWGDDSQHQLELPRFREGGLVAVVAFEDRTALIAESRAPSLLVGPLSQTVSPGQPLSLHVEASGYPLRYQWQKDGTNLEGGTGPVLNLGVATADLSGTYSVLISNRLDVLRDIPTAVIRVSDTAQRAAGAVVTWGPTAPTNLPAAALDGVVAIASGRSHGLALRQDGSVVAWGNNSLGQSTVPASATSQVLMIAAGLDHSVALRADGSVIAWGAGQTNGGRPPHFGQCQVPEAASRDVIAVAARGYRTVALKRDGTVLSWGANEIGGPGRPAFTNRNLVSIVTSLRSSAGLRRDGGVEIWEETPAGTPVPLFDVIQDQTTQLVAANSDIATLGLSGRPLVMPGVPGAAPLIPWPQPRLQHDIRSMAAGSQHLLYLKNDGTIEGVGNNSQGQLTLPPQADHGVLAVASGADDSVALVLPTSPSVALSSSDQRVFSGETVTFHATADGYPIFFQWNRDGIPVQGATNSTVTLDSARVGDSGDYTVDASNAAGTNRSPTSVHLTVVRSNGRVVVFGGGFLGKVPLPTEATEGVIAIASGSSFAAALRMDGSVVSWGQGASGQTSVPVEARSGVRAIACGPGFTLALKQEGSVVAWGFNQAGLLSIPTEARSGVVAIAAGSHALALRDDHTVVAWGYGDPGQTRVPPEIQGHAQAIAAGLFFSMALLDDGSVRVWGDNTFGERNIPPSAMQGVVAIAAGTYHALALRNDGSVVAWGDFGQGQSPVPGAASSGVLSIAAGGNTSLARKADGTIVQWGDEPLGSYQFPGRTTEVTTLAVGSNNGLAIFGTPLSLRTVRDAQGWSIQWSTNLSEFRLESSASLTAAPDWQPVLRTPASAGAEWSLSIPAEADRQFFRLTAP